MQTNGKEPAFQVQSVSKVYRTRNRREVSALDDVSVSIEDNEFVTLVGPSGCGKTTLLKMLGGLVAPSRGSIWMDGRELRGPSREIGLMFQTAVLMPWRTVLDNVLLPVEILGLDRAAHARRARELLALVGLEGFERHYQRELSGGMQQRVSLCRALIADPRMLLMDEPFGALDAMTREALSFELLRIWEMQRKTVVFVTHSIPEAVLLADRVVVMTPRPGRVAEIIPVDLSRPRTADMAFSPAFKECSDRIRALIFHPTSGPALS
jgi:NitT/TauT family transport system ATP-binding protein